MALCHCIVTTISDNIMLITIVSIISSTPSLPTNIVDFKGFDSSIILIQRDGIIMFTGDLPESLSQAMLVGCNVSRRLVISSMISKCYD